MVVINDELVISFYIWKLTLKLSFSSQAAHDEIQQILPMSGLIQSLNRNRWITERRHYSEATFGPNGGH